MSLLFREGVPETSYKLPPDVKDVDSYVQGLNIFSAELGEKFHKDTVSKGEHVIKNA